MQTGSIKPGSNVIVVDDLIATGGRSHSQCILYVSQVFVFNCAGGSAKAAGELVSGQGGTTLEYLFIIGLPLLKGSDKLDAPTYIMIDAE